jgi:DNA repair exonuclease SbcCD nuclease subunit
LPYRFVHAADIHLDSPLKSLALRDPELAELIGNATRRAFENIIRLCLTEQVDALMLAGDLYDGDQTSMKTARFLASQIRLLHEAGIRVFVIRGNHDALSRITKELTFPDSVKLFGGRSDAVALRSRAGNLAIAIHGISFSQPHAPESLLSKYKAPVADAINIGLMHTSLGGSPDHDDYAPCKVADLDAAGFRYWGLGHIHKRFVPQANSSVVMPGMPQGRDINESGPKSVTLVTVADDRSIHIEERLTSVAQFERVSLDLTGIEAWRDMVEPLAKALGDARARTPSEHLVARLHVAGTTRLAWQLRRDTDLLKAEADDRGFTTGKTWIEKVEMTCRVPNAASGPSPDPLAELRRLIDQHVMASESFRTELASVADELRVQLPQECRAFLGMNQQESETLLAEWAQEGAEDVMARLHAKPGLDAA